MNSINPDLDPALDAIDKARAENAGAASAPCTGHLLYTEPNGDSE